MALETLLNIGFGNYLVAARITSIVNPSSAPMKRLKEDAAKEGRLIDATQGRKTRALILLDSNQVVLSAIQPETLKQRFSAEESE
ncbi:MAG: DUF370 domain-containing protein [Desulfovibrionaceae bacterium]|nr:DUF370 domain-containing protein [Desulfovibrionaceae bacterium]